MDNNLILRLLSNAGFNQIEVKKNGTVGDLKTSVITSLFTHKLTYLDFENNKCTD